MTFLSAGWAPSHVVEDHAPRALCGHPVDSYGLPVQRPTDVECMDCRLLWLHRSLWDGIAAVWDVVGEEGR